MFAVLLPGFWSRIAVFLALVFGYVVSWLADVSFGTINSVLPGQNLMMADVVDGKTTMVPCPPGGDPSCVAVAFDHDRVSAWGQVGQADWIGFPSGVLGDGVDVVHGPSFSLTFILLVLPGVIA